MCEVNVYVCRLVFYATCCCGKNEVLVAFCCWTGYRISGSSCTANWWLQEQYGIPVPAVEVQRWPSEDYPSWYDVLGREWQLTIASGNMAVQL